MRARVCVCKNCCRENAVDAVFIFPGTRKRCYGIFFSGLKLKRMHIYGRDLAACYIIRNIDKLAHTHTHTLRARVHKYFYLEIKVTTERVYIYIFFYLYRAREMCKCNAHESGILRVTVFARRTLGCVLRCVKSCPARRQDLLNGNSSTMGRRAKLRMSENNSP